MEKLSPFTFKTDWRPVHIKIDEQRAKCNHYPFNLRYCFHFHILFLSFKFSINEIVNKYFLFNLKKKNLFTGLTVKLTHAPEKRKDGHCIDGRPNRNWSRVPSQVRYFIILLCVRARRDEEVFPKSSRKKTKRKL